MKDEPIVQRVYLQSDHTVSTVPTKDGAIPTYLSNFEATQVELAKIWEEQNRSSSTKKETAVQSLEEALTLIHDSLKVVGPVTERDVFVMRNFIKTFIKDFIPEHKEMEKEQAVEFALKFVEDGSMTAEQLYAKMYGENK